MRHITFHRAARNVRHHSTRLVMPVAFMRPSHTSQLHCVSAVATTTFVVTRPTRIYLENSSVLALKLYLSAPMHCALEYTDSNDFSPHLTSSHPISQSIHRQRFIILMSIRYIFSLAVVLLAVGVCVSADTSVKGVSVAKLAPGDTLTNCFYCPPSAVRHLAAENGVRSSRARQTSAA